MDHIAILNKKWKMIDKILAKEKTIESRWYVNKISPWGKVNKGDVVYLKDSGCPVTAKAIVSKVIYFARDDKQLSVKTKKYDSNIILKKYGKGICIQDVDGFEEYAKSKNYCILIFLKKAEKIKSFDIDKKGYSSSCAWMCVGDVNNVMKKRK